MISLSSFLPISPDLLVFNLHDIHCQRRRGGFSRMHIGVQLNNRQALPTGSPSPPHICRPASGHSLGGSRLWLGTEANSGGLGGAGVSVHTLPSVGWELSQATERPQSARNLRLHFIGDPWRPEHLTSLKETKLQ